MTTQNTWRPGGQSEEETVGGCEEVPTNPQPTPPVIAKGCTREMVDESCGQAGEP